MKKLLVIAAVLSFALYAWAGPRPAARVSVIGNVRAATYTASPGASLVLQCPGGIVWVRSLTALELAAGDMLPAGLGMTDGGAFGVLVDFTSQTDGIGVKLNSNENSVGLLGTDAGLVSFGQLEADGGAGPTDGGTLNDGGPVTRLDAGILPCFFSVP